MAKNAQQPQLQQQQQLGKGRGKGQGQVQGGKQSKKDRAAGQHGVQTVVPNKEIIQRMNFLHQAAILVATATAGVRALSKSNDRKRSSSFPTTSRFDKGKRARREPQEHKGEVNFIPTQQDSSSSHSGWQAREGEALRPPPTPAVAIAAASTSYLDTSGSTSSHSTSHNPKKPNLQIGTILPQAPYLIPLPRPRSELPQSTKKDLATLSNPRKEQVQQQQQSRKQGEKGLAAKHGEGKERGKQTITKDLSTVYVADMRTIARKSVLRIDPNIKRQLCRTCHTVLIPGITSSIRIKPSGPHVHIVRTECLACGQTRMIPSPPVPQPYLEGVSGVENNAVVRVVEGGTEMQMVKGAVRDLAVEDTADGAFGMGSTEGEIVIAEQAAEIKSSIEKQPGQRKQGGKQRRNRIGRGILRQARPVSFHERPEHAIWAGEHKVER